MGCGESKHDVVASGNTVTRKKSKKSKDIGTVLENASLLLQQQEGGDQLAVADHHVKDDISINRETSKESLITKESPNRFFSSRKEEESVDGMSEYESLFNDNEKKGAQETISDAENAEAEGNLAKETEKERAAGVKAEDQNSAPAATASEEKNLENANAVQEQSVASPSKDLKTV